MAKTSKPVQVTKKVAEHEPKFTPKREAHQSANEIVNVTIREPELIPEPPMKAAEPMIDTPAPSPLKIAAFPKYRVKKTKQTSLYGQMVTMHEGDILDSSGYGMPGIQNLIDGGVELEEVK